MDNAQRFLNAFAMIEKQLKQITGVTRYSRFYQLLNQASRSSGLVRKYEMELQEYADLRNAIVHQRSDEGHIIAIPIDEVVTEIEELARKICEPPRVSAHHGNDGLLQAAGLCPGRISRAVNDGDDRPLDAAPEPYEQTAFRCGQRLSVF